jgi:Na+/H+-dicarboxylate symporter
MGLSTRIFIGLLSGIAAGLFFGELVADLKIVGDVFIKLLQMTVLPYIVVSLIAGFGRMNLELAGRLALRGSAVLGVIWLIALGLVFVAAQAFPDLDTASFFASTAPDPEAAHSLVDVYIPANIFYSLSNNFVPAVVLFSILMGIALISVKDKSSVLPIFDGISDALAHVNALVVQLTPFGIFAIAAAAAGTLTIEELGRIQVYLVTYVGLSLVITFWIFPGLVAAVSGIPYREVLDTFKDALVTAFATGNQFVVLPLIAENCKLLLARHRLPDEESTAAIDVIVPVSFNFPSLGKLLVLLFVLFAAWFTDSSLDFGQRLSLAINGLLSLFGSINVAVPYLLDLLRIPADMFQLFLVTGVVVGRFGAMLAALHIIVLSVLGTLAVCGQLQLSLRRVMRYLLTSAAVLIGLVLCLRLYFEIFVPEPPGRAEVLDDIHASPYYMGSAEVLPALPAADAVQAGDRLQHIIDRGSLRVGYRPSNLPCTYQNGQGEVVGFDAEMAHVLARDLGVSLEFAPFEYDGLGAVLDRGQLDIAMSCIASLPDRYLTTSFSDSYLDLHLALVIPDHQRDLFADFETIRGRETLSVALVSSHYFVPRLKREFPQVEIVTLPSAEAFFTAAEPPADALLLSAEEGAAYAYRYPEYTVAQPGGGGKLPVAYALPRGELEWHEYIDHWIRFKRKDGTVESLQAYWMDGGATRTRTPRWSIIRDVFGWID